LGAGYGESAAYPSIAVCDGLDLFPEKEFRGLAGAVDQLDRIIQLGLVHVAQYADQWGDAYTPGDQH
jgi:hypothetical protein